MGGTNRVRGFKFASRAAGLKQPGRLDLALIYSETPARCAGVFTTNQVVAAPVVVTQPRIGRGSCQAVLINSANANACTGEQGMRDALRCSELVAHALGIDEDLVAVASTGVIGMPLPMDKFERHLPLLAAQLEGQGAEKVAEAIMTTDAFPKLSSAQGQVGGTPYTVLGVAKGAGMIHPDMATMLAYVLTDAAVSPALLDQALKQAVERSFNSITVDGDTSTNDMVLVLANGMAGTEEIAEGSEAASRFAELLQQVMIDLARMIVRDGEGATKVAEIAVVGAADREDARRAARTVATSSLVKTAFFGEDANWGRIIAALGRSGARLDQGRIGIKFDDVEVVRGGIGVGAGVEEPATAVLKQEAFRVVIDLGLGEGSWSYYTSDLGYEYIRINADYRT